MPMNIKQTLFIQRWSELLLFLGLLYVYNTSTKAESYFPKSSNSGYLARLSWLLQNRFRVSL